MEDILRSIAVLAISYLVGAIPFALIVGKVFFRTDVRTRGSGNLGATNVMRVLGWRAGIAVLALDSAKGACAVVVAELLYVSEVGGTNLYDGVLIGAAIAAVLGHSYSPYIRFRGGKGVATAAGALLFITPDAWLIMLITFIGVVAIWRMVSLGSVVVATMYPMLCIALYRDRPVILGLSFLAAAVVLWRHRSNIARIARGQEPKLSKGKAASVVMTGTDSSEAGDSSEPGENAGGIEG